MKILHICLACFYIDRYSYQENILPRMHKEQGHEVRILASTETFVEGRKFGYLEPSEYINEDGIPVRRLPYVKWLPAKLGPKIRIYPGVYDYLMDFKPDLIFMHDVQFLSITQVIKYAKKHKVRIIADGHADFSNSANTFASRWLLHEIIYKPFVRKAEPYIEKFYGTLPARADFFKNVYKMPSNKVSFLPMGVDDMMAEKHGTKSVGSEIREKFDIAEDDFLIVTGGKIDLAKTQTLLLMKAVNAITKHNVKLLIFGSIVNELKDEFDKLCNERIQYAGWANVEQSYEYFAAADLVVFPGRHSVYWEQVAGIGKPLMVKHWDGTTHVDLGGNVEFLYEDSIMEIQDKIELLISDKDKFLQMKNIAEAKGKEYFSYYGIARRSIE